MGSADMGYSMVHGESSGKPMEEGVHAELREERELLATLNSLLFLPTFLPQPNSHMHQCTLESRGSNREGTVLPTVQGRQVAGRAVGSQVQVVTRQHSGEARSRKEGNEEHDSTGVTGRMAGGSNAVLSEDHQEYDVDADTTEHTVARTKKRQKTKATVTTEEGFKVAW